MKGKRHTTEEKIRTLREADNPHPTQPQQNPVSFQ